MVDYVNLARRKHDDGHIDRDHLLLIASSLEKMEKTWKATAYVDDNLGYAAQPFPTRADVLLPFPRIGDKREFNDFSVGTEGLSVCPATQRFRSSSPNPTAEGVDIAVEIIPDGENLRIPHVPATRRQSLGAMGARPRGLPTTPLPRQHDVAAWVSDNVAVAPSPPPSSELQLPMLNAMQRNSAQKRAMELAKKENKDLKLRLLKADEDANTRLNSAVKAKEEEIVAKANLECGAEIKKERQKANAASATAKEALQTAAAADQRAASANQEAVNAVDMAHRLRKERDTINQRLTAELEAARSALREREEEVRRQKDAVQLATEAKQKADANAIEQRRLLEQEKAKKRTSDYFLQQLPPTTQFPPSVKGRAPARRKK